MLSAQLQAIDGSNVQRNKRENTEKKLKHKISICSGIEKE